MPQKPADGIACEEKDFSYMLSDEVILKFTISTPSPPFDAKLPMECKALVSP